jgi:hypothetical protein
MRWLSVFGVVLLWISDRGSHLKCEVVRRLQKELKAKRHFSTANRPWSISTIDSACKYFIRAFRVELSNRCYALLRIRTLSISYAEGFRVISCG